MNFPNQELIEEPYLLIKIVKGYNLLIGGSKEQKETELILQKKQSSNQEINNNPIKQSSESQDQLLIKQNSNNNNIKQGNQIDESEDISNSFLKIRNHHNSSHPFTISVSIHTPTAHLFDTPSLKTLNGSISFQNHNKNNQKVKKTESASLEWHNQKDKTQSLYSLSPKSIGISHKRWKSNQPTNEPITEKKIFLKDVQKYIMLDVMDSDCYMEKVLLCTQVLPIEYFSIPTNAGKIWKIWLKMNKYNYNQTNQQQNYDENDNSNIPNLRSSSLYLQNLAFDKNVQQKNLSADKQIEKITGINSSNIEQYYVQVQPPIPFYLETQSIFNLRNNSENDTSTQVGTKADLSNFSSKKSSPNHCNQEGKNNTDETINQFSDSTKQGQIKTKVIDENNESKLDKNYSWIQLEITVMDRGSLMKLSASITSIEEIERSGMPNLFFYNIIITRNDGLTYLIKRRYQQFRDLRTNLSKNIKKVSFISFPQKSFSKITSLFFKKSYLIYFEQAQQRREKLQIFLNSITDMDEVYRQKSFIQFFTQGGQLDSDIVSANS